MDHTLGSLLYIAAVHSLNKRRARRRRSFWVQKGLQTRQVEGEFHRLISELRFGDARFQRYFRVDKTEFAALVNRVGPRISRMDTTYRRAIGPAERLAVCLRYLATGDSFRTIARSYRVGHSTVCSIVAEVSRAIWDCLVEDYMPVPSTEDWRAISADFSHRWNFPNCLGSVDGKHVVIQSPKNSGSLYHNDQGTFSIVLLAVVDAKYCFRIIDVGGYGRTSEGGTLANSTFGQALINGTLQIPEDALLPGAEHLGPQPHVFVADEAFPLRRDLMRPFPAANLCPRKRVFNFRLSRARRIVENTFGILSSQWGMYRRVIGMSPENVEACVKATCILHNFIRRNSRTRREPVPASEGEGSVMQGLRRSASHNAPREAIRVREVYASYLSAEGAVAWQPTE
ncbi:uncharacterized protein zgc:194221 [Cololabis saira]|uniref:uncharacterized protein zgc:194221 n=1 Tax=Cololabis saira TaxID=129043 RepID=UPI002AD515E7|nr:uncharacterized protein zgc:194221 [Cololabis saira]